MASIKHVDPRKELLSFFDWNPPIFKPLPLPQSAYQTKVFRFYNQHLAEDQVCKSVIHVPNLHRSIANVVDDALSASLGATEALEVSVALATTLDSGRTATRRADYTMRNLDAVTDWYSVCTADLLEYPASSMGLHPGVRTSSLAWVQTSPNTDPFELDSHLAIRQDLDESVPLDIRRRLEYIRDHQKAILTLHPSQLAIGSDDDMVSVVSTLEDADLHWKRPEYHAMHLHPLLLLGNHSEGETPSDAHATETLLQEAVDGNDTSPTAGLANILRYGGSSLESVREADAKMRKIMFRSLRELDRRRREDTPSTSTTGTPSDSFESNIRYPRDTVNPSRTNQGGQELLQAV